jgi:hypothetical protein
MNDIYSTSMNGRYRMFKDDQQIESGDWHYRGYGNAEIELESTARREADSQRRLHVRIHSAESTIDRFEVTLDEGLEAEPARWSAEGERVGVFLKMSVEPEHGDAFEGGLDIPPDLMLDGPSPLWLIHRMMVAMPPSDRDLVVPVARLQTGTGEVATGFARMRRSADQVHMVELENDGSQRTQSTIQLADDGFPREIHGEGYRIEILRLPQHDTGHDSY